jgi:hypothetical protein
MSHRILSALLLTAACAAPAFAGELLIPLASGTAADGTTWSTRLWVTNTGAVARSWTSTFIAQGADGTKAPAGKSFTVAAGATVPATNLAPAGQSGLLLVSGAPQLLLTARLEGKGKDGALKASSAGPLISGHDLAPAGGTLHLHGLSHRQNGLITDLYLVNAARQTAQCTVDAYRDDATRIGGGRYTLPPLSLRAVEKALAVFGSTGIDEARITVTCDQAFYAYARVAKPGSGEMNVMTPPAALAR